MSVTSVILPKLGLTMDEGTLVAWRKAEGERVEAGEVLFDVETDKSVMEVEAPATGYVRSVLAPTGTTIPVSQVIALISTTADEPLGELPEASPFPAFADEADEAAAPAAGPEPIPATAQRSADGSTAGGRIVASPAARKRAQELGLDLAAVTATGGGRISVDDVEAAAARAGGAAAAGTAAREAHAGAGPRGAEGPAPGAPTTPAEPGSRLPLSRMRRTIAERMTASFRDVPQFSVSRDVEMTAADQVRRAAGVSYTDVLIAAVAAALRGHRQLTMRYDGDAFVAGDGIHIGLAVALDEGLLVPVLRDADAKDLTTIARERAALQDHARAGSLTPEALSGSVFTISNLGQFGVDRFTAIVNPPEAAILAVGRVREAAIVRDGALVVAPVCSLTLSVDHRVADGAQAAAFLAELTRRLEATQP